LECRLHITINVECEVDTVTNETGTYKFDLEVKDKHVQDICDDNVNDSMSVDGDNMLMP
jgi:hypothetical protein